MLIHLTSAVLTVLPLSVPEPPAPPAAVEVSILAMVPENAFALAYCADFSALRSRAERNDWVRLLRSENGAPLMAGMADAFHAQTHTDMQELLALGTELRGESVFFFAGKVAGFLTEAPVDRTRLAEAMRVWLPDPGPLAVSRTIDLGGAKVEMVAWPESSALGWKGRQGHYAALVDHPALLGPGVLGLFSGDDAEALVATIERSLVGYAPDRQAPVVRGFEAARASRPPCFGVEAYVDFTPFVPGAEEQLARAMEDVIPDPKGLLGIEEDLWLLAAGDVHPGTRIDCTAWLNVPKETLAADLADTFRPLAVGLPGELPKGLWSLYALRWDLAAFYRRARAALEEKHGKEALKPVDDGLGAAKALSGVDPIVEVVEQLEGTFAFFLTDLSSEGEDPPDFAEIGFLAGLLDGEAFLDSFEKLVGGGPLEEELDLIDIEDVEVYSFGDSEVDGGFAFLPRSVVLSPGRETLTRALRAATGVEGASLLDGTEFQGAFDQNAGCCFFVCVDLSAVEARMDSDLQGEFALPPAEGETTGRNPFDSLLIHTARRTHEGFRFELHTR